MSYLLVAKACAKTKKRKARQLTTDRIMSEFRILNKDNQLVPFAPNRAQHHLMQNLTGRDIILKARQLGFSTVIRALHESKAMTQTSRLATLAHDQNTTNLLRRMSKRMWEHLPEQMRPERGMDNATTTVYNNTGSEVIIQTAGSSAGGRGGTLSDVHGSEIAFWKNANDNMAGIMQAVPIDGNIVLESTPNGAQGWFYETCMQALDGQGVWKLHFYEWWWNDDYRLPLENGESLHYTDDELDLITKHQLTPEQIKWRRYKMQEIPHTFKQEYPEDVYSCFLASGHSFFGNIESVFTSDTQHIPTSTHRYVAGLDFGQSNDYTVMIVIDTHTSEMVDMLRVNRLDWQTIRGRVKAMQNKWQCRILAERNAMGTNIALFREGGVSVQPFDTTAQSKPMLIQSLYTGLHEQGLKLQNNADLKHELRNFVSEQTPSGHWKYNGANGVHDDCVIALALAWRMAMIGEITIQAI